MRTIARLLIAIAAIVALAEVGARIFLAPARYHASAIELYEPIGFRGVPGFEGVHADELGAPVSHRFNRLGFRGREPGDREERDVRRVAFVGDSFLVGEAVGDEQLVTSLTEKALRARGREAEVYNLSGVDTGTAQQLLMLREYGPDLRPTEVVLFLYTGDDLINNEIGLAGRSPVSTGDYIRPYLVEENGELGRRYTHPSRAWLRHRSRLFAEVEALMLGLGTSGQVPALNPRPARVGAAQRVRLRRAPFEELEIFRAHDPGDAWERAWRSTERLLVAFREECDALGARLLVVIVPNAQQVVRNAKGLRLDVSHQVGTGRTIDSLLDWDLPEKRLQRFAAANAIEVAALLPVLRDRVVAGARPYGRDDYFSPEGHAIAAETVLAWLAGEPSPQLAGGRRGQPVSALPDAVGGRLSFEAEPHLRNLGEGFVRWAPGTADGEWGWTLGGSATLVVPLGEGDLVVRGVVPTPLAVPIKGSVIILGLASQPLEIDRVGPFELRVPASLAGRLLEPARGGYAVVELRLASPVERDGQSVGAQLHEIGFEATPPAP